MPSVQILYWHEIPTQVRVREGRQRVSKPLSPRFMESVDRAAMRARLTNHTDYPAGFHWGAAEEREGDPEEIATAVVAEIETQYETIPWRDLADRLRAEKKAEQEQED
ncbi:MAG: virulence factor [Caldilineales bacterium]|nr:virulence factor [Caldilineales bacterium]